MTSSRKRKPGKRRVRIQKGTQLMLKELFKSQAELNKRTGFDAKALRENFDPQEAGKWISNYLAAMSSEIEELRNCTFWKHWCAEASQGR